MAFNFGIRPGDTIESSFPGQTDGDHRVTPGMGSFRVAGFFKRAITFRHPVIMMSLPASQRLYSLGNIVGVAA